EVDVGVLADPQPLDDAGHAEEADEAESDEPEHQHPGEHVVADGDVRERAARRYEPGVFLFTHRLPPPEAPDEGVASARDGLDVGPATGCTATPSASRSE